MGWPGGFGVPQGSPSWRSAVPGEAVAVMWWRGAGWQFRWQLASVEREVLAMQRLISLGERSWGPVRPRRAMPVLPADVRNLLVPATLIQESTGLTMTNVAGSYQLHPRSPRGRGRTPLGPGPVRNVGPHPSPPPQKKSSGALS